MSISRSPIAIVNSRVDGVYEKNTKFYKKDVKIRTGNGETYSFNFRAESLLDGNHHNESEKLLVAISDFEVSSKSIYKISITVEVTACKHGWSKFARVKTTEPREVHKSSPGINLVQSFSTTASHGYTDYNSMSFVFLLYHSSPSDLPNMSQEVQNQ